MTSIAQRIPCLICGDPLTVRMARGRKSGKPFVMLICGRDGRHFRGFITDQTFVAELLTRLEGQLASSEGGDDPEDGTTPSRRSKTNLERAG